MVDKRIITRLRLKKQQENQKKQTSFQQNQNQITQLQQQIKDANQRLDNMLKERERIFGSNPKLSVRRSTRYKEMTSLRRAERKIIEELNKILSEVKKGATIDLNKVSNLQNQIRKIEKQKTSRTIAKDVRPDVALSQLKQAQKKQDIINKQIEIGKALGKATARNQKVKVQRTSVNQLRESLIPIFGIQLASKIKPTSLASLNSLYSSQTKENQRKDLEQFLSASIPRTLSEKKQIDFLNKAIAKEKGRRQQNLDSLKTLNLNYNDAEKLYNKQLTGQSLTPKDKALLSVLELNRGKKLDSNQWKNLKNASLVVPAFNYGKNLVLRRKGGEKTPLWNDIKEIKREFKAATYDNGYQLGSILGSATKKSIESSFKYGVRITKEAQKGNFVLDDDIKFIANEIAQGLGKAVDFGAKVGKFVKDNPLLTGVIVSNALAGSASKLWTKFKKDPVETFITALLLKGVSKNSKFIQAIAKLDPKYAKFSKGKIKLSNGIILKEQTVSTGALPFAKQVKLYTGKTVTAVNASAERLTSLIKRKKIIRKPFVFKGDKKFPQGEDSFPKPIRDLLNKFDSGEELTVKEIVKINKFLRENVADNATILERSLYVDPDSGVRLSRLKIGKSKSASIKDILTGNFRFTEPKPQILIFDETKISKYPKNILKIIDKIDKKGTKYKGFDKDLAILTKYQTKVTGSFKIGGSPIFRGGVELEATLAPRELIKRIKRVGFTYINGTKVDFVTAEIFKPSKALKSKLSKALQGKLNEKELKLLEKDLSKKLGRKINVETPNIKTRIKRREITSKTPVLRLTPKGIRVIKFPKLIRTKSIPRTTKNSNRVTSNRISVKKTKVKSTNKRVITSKPTNKTRISTTIKSSGNRNISSPKTNIKVNNRISSRVGNRLTPSTPIKTIRPPKLQNLKKTPQSRQGYIIQIKEGNKIIAKSSTILPLNRARNLMRKRLDNTPQASGDIIPKGKTNIVDVKNVILQNKFRTKRSKNTKVLITVEKKKYRLDKAGEKKGLKKAKVNKKKK